MKSPVVTSAMTRMARKMVLTILARHHLSPLERRLLINDLFLVAAQDLLDSGYLRLRRPLPPGICLELEQDRARIVPQAGSRLQLKLPCPDFLLERAAARAEAVFDRHHLDEEERATLYTALPCLALEAFRDYLEWLKPPPFAELGW